MDSTTVARVMSSIPERTPWRHRGLAFAAPAGQSERVRLLASYLGWM